MVVIWWSPNHTSNYLPKLRWGNHSTVKCSKSNFLEAIIQHNGIFCHLPVIDVWVLLHGSRRREGGKHWRLGLLLLQQDLHLNIVWKYHWLIDSFFRSLVICFCSYFNYPASRTSSHLNFPGNFDWITSSGDLGNEGGAWSAGAEYYFWNYSSFSMFMCV